LLVQKCFRCLLKESILTSVAASVADCSKQLVQRTRMHDGRNLIVSVVVRIDHCCQTEVGHDDMRHNEKKTGAHLLPNELFPQ